MRSLESIRIAALTALAVVACGEAISNPEPAGDDFEVVASGALNSFTNNLDNGNPRIVRQEGDYYLEVYDLNPGSSLVAVHSSTPYCGGEYAPVAIQTVHHDPEDLFGGRFHGLLLGRNINIWILDLASSGPCFGFGVVASGTGRLQFTDNDVLSTVSEGSNANAYHFRADGKLTTPSGSRAQYSWRQWGSFKLDANDELVFDHAHETFNLKIK